MTRRSVLVTGASSGIGRECALHLAARGFTVFAGIRRPEDGKRLVDAALGHVVPVALDVTDEESLDEATKRVGELIEEDSSFSIVNNAGITVAGPLELIGASAMRRQLDVNVIGTVAVIERFLPLVRRRTGRIVIMGSLFGRIALPFVSPYAAAKFALEAITDSLSLELRQWGIRVVLLEPGSIATPLWKKTKEMVLESVTAHPRQGLDLYRTALESFERLTDSYAARGISPSRVAAVVERALVARRPRTRYLVGRDAKVFGRVAPLLPDRLRHWIVARLTLNK